MLELSMVNGTMVHWLSPLRSRDRANWIRWVKANLIGGILGWIFIAVSMITTLGFSLFACWLIVGPCVAGAQYIVISEHINNFPLKKSASMGAGIWIMSATLGMLGVLICYYEIPGLLFHKMAKLYIELGLSKETITFIDTSLGFASGGLLYGAIQGMTLRNPRALAMWCALSTLGWGIGATLGTQTAQIVMNLLRGEQFQLAAGYVLGPFDALYFACAGITGTFIFGLITGVFISHLPSQPAYTQDKSQTARNDPA
ncbi:MAG TPA: hypothetical protein VLQ48_11950 [Chloroflexia bacterium]|nr:hypothetical protein [Chloroflexia bacterium]